MRRTLALRMKRMLEKHGKKGYFARSRAHRTRLNRFLPCGCICQYCMPPIAIDDAVRYRKPLITPFELEVALGEKQWETGYMFDEIP